MAFKLLWILVIVWIGYRVFLASRNLFRIAIGRDDTPLPGAGNDPFARRSPPEPTASADAAPSSARKHDDVEDARWVDL